MTGVEAWRALGALQAWGWQRPPSVEEEAFEASLRRALALLWEDALIALDVLEAWDWQRPAVVAREDFERMLRIGTVALGVGEGAEPIASARANRERSMSRLAAYLPAFNERLAGADEARSAALLDDALRWSENAFEAETLRCCARARADRRKRGLDDEGLGIDDLILRAASPRWQKVAMVVGLVLSARRGLHEADVARNVEALVARGLLAARGDLSRMTSSEVRIPPAA